VSQRQKVGLANFETGASLQARSRDTGMDTGNKGCFDQVAHQWDEMRRSFFSNAVREKALCVADVQPGELAADICRSLSCI
jgi:hypothetical protein